MRIGITGHVKLTEATADLVTRAVRELLVGYPAVGLVGVSCLAAGADTIFAEAVLDRGGRLEAIIPSEDYRVAVVAPEHAERFDRLVRAADRVRTMPFAAAGSEAYAAANEALLESCEQLIAIWDGVPAADPGGTAATVERARSLGIPTHVVWPAGSMRA